MKKILIIAIFTFISLAVFSFEAKAQIAIANDPTILSVGARPLGMGKAFAALANDPSAIFLNPAGLANISTWQLSSMSSKYINEFDYVQVSMVIPTRFGNFGLGYGGTGYSFQAPSPEVVVIGGEEKYFPSPTDEVSASWGDSALLLSYSRKYWENLSLGGNLKIYSQNLSGSNFSTITAQGLDLDLGLFYRQSPQLQLAAVLYNILPSSLGGKVSWSNGIDESLPSSAKLGLSYQLVGPQGALQWEEQEAVFSFDYESFLTRSKTNSHLGLEWTPISFLTLRLGSDNGDTTYGIGISYNQFRFDYAYHTYFNQSWASTNYFSFSYGVGKLPPPKPKEYLSLTSPDQNIISYDEKITLRGKILDEEVAKITATGNPEVLITKDNLFLIDCPLRLGNNIITIEAFDEEGKLLKAITWQGLRLLTFRDLPDGYWAKLPIEVLATLNIITGYPDGTFRPEGNITRAEMCTLLMKTKDQRLKTKDLKAEFKDVSEKHWAASYIAQAVAEGVMKGYPNGTFRPNGNITRAEGVAVIARYDELKVGLTRLLEAPYPDLPGRHWAALEVTAAKEAGFLKYLEGKNFEPNKNLTRAEVAEILYRTGKIKQILLDHNISLP